MKRQVLTLVTVIAVLLVSGSAYAQTISVKAEIPFDFVVSGHTLAAGPYTIDSMGNGGAKALLVRSADQQEKMIVLASGAQSAQPADRTKLVFHRYGARYFLSQIWVAGNPLGHQLPKSRREAEVARD